MENENVYQQKYLKYKQKYINLVEQLGGIVYKPGKYVFLFDSRILGAGTPLLNSIEQYGKLDKPNFNKITDEIGNHNGWYYYPSLTGKPQLKIIESSAKIASTTTKSAASATMAAASSAASATKAGLSSAASAASAAAKKAGDKVHETYCNSCRKSCEIQGGSAISTIDLDEATKGITKGITKVYVQGLVNLLAEKGIEVNRAIHCELGFTGNKIIDYYKF
jgi:cytochrome c5